MTKKICGFEFILIPFKVEPTKDPRQNIHENYNKKNEKKLLKYGEGPFCKFRIEVKYDPPPPNGAEKKVSSHLCCVHVCCASEYTS